MPLRFSSLGARQKESDIARLMTLALERPKLLNLAAGFTDTPSLPLEAVTQVAKALGDDGDRSVLQYGSNQGRLDLREALTRRLERQDAVDGQGPSFSPDAAFIANGSQQALYLAIQTLCDPGDVVLVEQPTYFVFLELLRGLGVEAMPMPEDSSGAIDTQRLEAMLEELRASGDLARVKALYLVSYYANPTGRSVSSDSKRAVVELLGRFDGSIALIEDAAYRELYYERPHDAPSALGLAASLGVPTLYASTMTKPFASGLKVGYAYCSEPEWLRRMLAVKGQQDFGSAHYPQAIAARALLEGLFDAQLDSLRQSYRAKMEQLDSILRPSLRDLGWSWERPEGGLYLWLQAPDDLDTGFESSWHARCLEEGVLYVPGELCFARGTPRNCVRASFGVLQLPQLEEAGRRLLAAARGFAKTPA